MGSNLAEASRSDERYLSSRPSHLTHMLTKPDSVSPLAAAWPESSTAEVADSWLSASDQDRSIRRDLREIFHDELWPYRGLLYELMRRDIRVRYKQTALGFAWAVLMPSLVVLAGATVRFAMAYVGGRHLGAQDLAGIDVVQVLLMFGIFFTPVFFEPEMFGALGARVMMLNPLAPLMEGLRLSVVMDHNLLDTLVVQGRHGAVLAWSPWYLVYSGACAITALLAGLLVFHRAEPKFAEYV